MKKIGFLLGMGWLLSACAVQQSRVDVNDDWLPGPTLHQTYAILQSGDFRTLSARQQEAVEQEIDRQMHARGYRRVMQNPDLAIVFSLYDRGFSLRDARVVRLNESSSRKKSLSGGTLVIQMVDETLNRSVWLGYASGLMARNDGAPEDRLLRAAARQILGEYREIAPRYVR